MSENNSKFIGFAQLGQPKPQSLPGVLNSTPSRDADISICHDNLPPIANVGRIMKDVLPPQTKISKQPSLFVDFVMAKLHYSLWVQMHPQNFKKSLLKSIFHYSCCLYFYIYKRSTPLSKLL